MEEIGTDNGQGASGSRQWLIIAALAIYVALLVLGTIGELFDVQWILDLPIFKGP